MTLVAVRARAPPGVKIDLQILDMRDYVSYFQGTMWYQKPVHILYASEKGVRPTNEQFWAQRPTPGTTDADAALCYYDIRKTTLSYADILTRYYHFWRLYPTYVDTCFHMFRSVIF